MEEEIREEEQPKKGRKKAKEEAVEEVVSETIGNHPSFTTIRGGICEFCGNSVLECPFHQKAFKEGIFRCLCGGSANPSTFSQSIYKYWAKHKVWICNAEGCRQRVEMMGGYTDPEIMRFYL